MECDGATELARTVRQQSVAPQDPSTTSSAPVAHINILLDAPRNRPQICKGNANQKRKQSCQYASNSCGRGRLGRHASGLKVERPQVADGQNENRSPVPKECIGKGRQRQKVGHGMWINWMIPDGVSASIISRARNGRITVVARTPLGGIVATQAGVVGAGHARVRGANARGVGSHRVGVNVA
jgi:hypothetical protein